MSDSFNAAEPVESDDSGEVGDFEIDFELESDFNIEISTEYDEELPDPTPVLDREEYVEQAYLFRTLRERLSDGIPAQEVLDVVKQELLATTKLSHAMTLMVSALRHRGELAGVFQRLNHYFTPYQAHLIGQAESDSSRLLFTQALLILEREAEYRAKSPTLQGLFIFQIEALSRNRLGYVGGIQAMQGDGFYDDDWVDFMNLVKKHLGWRELAELIYARSEHYVSRRRYADPGYEPNFPILFGEKEGKIAAANIRKDPKFLFSTLQRQLDYPVVPRLPRRQSEQNVVADLVRRLKNLETKVGVLEAELNGTLDLEQFYVNNSENGHVTENEANPVWPEEVD